MPDLVVAFFALLPLLLSLALMAGTSHAWRQSGAPPKRAVRVSALTGAAVVAWMVATGLAAMSGVLKRWTAMPPPFMVLVVLMVALAVWLAWGPVGERLARHVPLWMLVAVQGFRLPLEVAMHAMAERGVMPMQMSYSGWNFDIVTGATAIVVAAIAARQPAPRLVALWNVMGLALLINVMTIAMLSTPAIRAFGDARLNEWVADVPFVWLPAVMVLAAVAGHLLIFRALHPTRRAG